MHGHTCIHTRLSNTQALTHRGVLAACGVAGSVPVFTSGYPSLFVAPPLGPARVAFMWLTTCTCCHALVLYMHRPSIDPSVARPLQVQKRKNRFLTFDDISPLSYRNTLHARTRRVTHGSLESRAWSSTVRVVPWPCTARCDPCVCNCLIFLRSYQKPNVMQSWCRQNASYVKLICLKY